MPDPQKVLTTVRRATELYRATPGRSGAVVQVSGAADVLVAGDLHGRIDHFKTILGIAGLDRHPGRHLVLQELVHGNAYYPNGGDKSHRLVDLVAALKCQYPDRVHVILGNHELAEMTSRPIIKAGVRLNALFRLGLVAAYPTAAAEIYAAYLELFSALPLAVRLPNRVFLCHTIPDGSALDAFDAELLNRGQFEPAELEKGGMVYALTWSRDFRQETADRFCALVDADCLITGHQPCPHGYQIPNSRQIIIDCASYPACYCLVPTDRPVPLGSLEDLVHHL